MSNYFVIHNSDGDTTISEMSGNELKSALSDQDWGSVGFIEKLDPNDPNYWGDNILIIKGEIVVPRPKEVIQTYEL